MPRLLFCSWHNYLDPVSGAASGTRSLLELLQTRGWRCQAACGPQLDFVEPVPLSELFSKVGFRPSLSHDDRITRFEASVNGVSASMCIPESTADTQPFLNAIERTVGQTDPDIILTYGGNDLQRRLHTVYRRSRARVVFALHNHSYARADLFQQVDLALTPSEFSRSYYRRSLQIESVPVVWPWTPGAAETPSAAKYVTFVNPQAEKGLHWWHGIARELGRVRPEIPFLMVQGRAGHNNPVEYLPNVTTMTYTAQPEEFYRKTHILIMPSLGKETFGRVAAEAMTLGIPVLVSDRGALPETVGHAGIMLPIPERFTPRSTTVPTAEEVAPWVQRIVQLWDDAELYRSVSTRCREHASRWNQEKVVDHFEHVFRQLLSPTGCELAPSFLRSTT